MELHKKTVSQLRQYCKNKKIKGYSKYKKAELIKFIKKEIKKAEKVKKHKKSNRKVRKENRKKKLGHYSMMSNLPTGPKISTYTFVDCKEFIKSLTPSEVASIPWKILLKNLPGQKYYEDLDIGFNPTICRNNPYCIKYYTKCYWLSRDKKLFEEFSNAHNFIKKLFKRLKKELDAGEDLFYKKRIVRNGEIRSIVKPFPEIEDVRSTLQFLADLIRSGEIDDWSDDDLAELVNNVVRTAQTRRVFMEVSKGLTNSQKKSLGRLAMANGLLEDPHGHSYIILENVMQTAFSPLKFKDRLTDLRERNFTS